MTKYEIGKKLSAVMILCMVVGFGLGGCQGWTAGYQRDYNKAAEKGYIGGQQLGYEHGMKIKESCEVALNECMELNFIYTRYFRNEFVDP